MSDAEADNRISRWDALLGIGAEREAIAKAVAEERAAVVALLREEERLYEKHWWLHVASSLRRLCDIIDRGEHRREEER